MNDKPLLRLDNITKRYGRRTVLNGVSFEVAPGRIVALLGGNGAGKTTTLKCIPGVTSFDGTVEVDGLRVDRRGRDARRLVGYVPQLPALSEDDTCAQALAFTPKDELAPLTVRRPSEASQTPLSRQPDRPAADTTVAAAKEASPANSVPPSRVLPDAAAAPAFDGNWLAVVAQLKAGGMARMLAEHCEVQRFDTAAIEFCVPPEHKHLLERAYQDKLKSELKQLFGANLRVSFAIGSIDGLTPARVADNDRQARLAKAKAAIEEDPFVQGLISGLDAKVIESSIKPIDQ